MSTAPGAPRSRPPPTTSSRPTGVPVEVVAVGDAELDAGGEALVAAAREAMVNAAQVRRRLAGVASSPRSSTASCRSSSATAARASTSRRSPPTAAACASRSSGGCARHGGPGADPPLAGRHRGRAGAAREERRDARASVIVDDHELFRAGVRAELERLVDDRRRGAATVDEAVALIAAEQPDVVLLDVHLPDGGGVGRAAPRRGRAARRRSSWPCRSPTPPRT